MDTLIRNSSSEETFGTTELHELILSCLRPGPLFRCRRVSRKWNALILDSTLLQQTLFLAPEAPTKAWILRYDPTVPDCPYGSSSDSSSDSDIPRSSYEIAAIVPAAKVEASRIFQTDKTCLVARPNPSLLSTIPSAWQTSDLNLRAANGEGCDLYLPNQKSNAAQSPAPTRMFLTQPPATSVAISISFWGSLPSSTDKAMRYFEVLRRDKGVRYADLLAIVQPVQAAESDCIKAVHLDFEGLVFASLEDDLEAERQAWVCREREAARVIVDFGALV